MATVKVPLSIVQDLKYYYISKMSEARVSLMNLKDDEENWNKKLGKEATNNAISHWTKIVTNYEHVIDNIDEVIHMSDLYKAPVNVHIFIESDSTDDYYRDNCL